MYEEFEDAARRDRESYPVMPSPRGIFWKSYVKHRLQMCEDAFAVYTKRKYAQINLNKYIESTRALDKIAVRLVANKPSIIYIGTGGQSPCSPIRIKKHVRCPKIRKIVRSLMKICILIIVRYEDEYNTSQTCSICFGRFDRRFKNHRYKVCQDCHPDAEALLPNIIVTEHSRRDLAAFREIEIFGREQQGLPIPHGKRLVSKTKIVFKQWQLEREPGDAENPLNQPKKTVHQRDIVAAKCILYKGK